jgi:hypothetical protein
LFSSFAEATYDDAQSAYQGYAPQPKGAMGQSLALQFIRLRLPFVACARPALQRAARFVLK